MAPTLQDARGLMIFMAGLCVGLILTLGMKAAGPLSTSPVVRDFYRTIVNPDRLLGGPQKSIEFKRPRDIRVLCWIMTQEKSHETKARHVKATWGKRCDKLLFISDGDSATLPALNLHTPKGYDHLTAKTMHAFDYIFKHYKDDYDWFLKADDDTYVIVENLRYLLSTHAPSESVFFGHHFKTNLKQGYFSGGGGYVISREALNRYGNRSSDLCSKDLGSEDVEFARCMEQLGVKTGDSRDAMGRSRFHCFQPEKHLKGDYLEWYRRYDKYGAKYGIDSISDYAVSFHYVPPEQMYALEFYVYHLRPFGVFSGEQKLNLVSSVANKSLTI